MRLGILGGTFDPVHYGHLLAAEEVRVQLGLTRVIFAPAALPPHKIGEPISPIAHRLAMVRLAIASNPYFVASTVDVDRPGPHYTVDTVTLLRKEWGTGPDDTYFVMGLDSLADILSWHQPHRLIRLCRLAVVGRPGYSVDMDALNAALPGLASRVEFITMPRLAISSNDIRRRVRKGLSIKYQVPEAVEEYIYQHGLYREGKG